MITLPEDLRDAVVTLARTPAILVASDYDGTLAPIVEDPSRARPERESVTALRQLAAMTDTHVAVVSGRALRDLAALSRLPDEIHLVGSHGSEFDVGFAEGLDPEAQGRRDALVSAMRREAVADPGLEVEVKPAGAAFHYRRADPTIAEPAVSALRVEFHEHQGLFMKEGKKVLEFSVVPTSKGAALDQLRHDLGAEAVLFFGDDVTDEDGFARLTGPDIGVKIGDGETKAAHRLTDPTEVARLLVLLVQSRRAWLEGHQAPFIERHTFLSDRRTGALVTPDARVTWMCVPRADSPSIFAELLGGPAAGYFAVAPANGAAPTGQRYLTDTMVCETRWPDLKVTDYLDVSDGRMQHPAGRTDLVRLLEGSGESVITFAPRLDYGRAATELEIAGDGIVVRGSAVPIALRAPGVAWEIEADGVHQSAVGHITLDGEPVTLELRCGDDALDPSPVAEAERRRVTAHAWTEWVSALRLPRVEPELVARSALVIAGLCHGPSGSILAAATTSLPEELGGVRNWDYRFCWPRDAALAASALVDLGCTREPAALLHWLFDRVAAVARPDQIRPVYPPVGDDLLPEAVLTSLSGYHGSRPVRVGNAAEHQLQLDMFGPIVDLIHRLAAAGEPVSAETWELVSAMVDAVANVWHEPDHGIWEERRPRRHHVHSKVMCWQAVDRAIRIAGRCGRAAPESWSALRDEIVDDVLTRGWNDRVGAFTCSYGDDDLDASVLHLGLSGLLDPADGRWVATVKAIERQLRHGPAVYRYRFDDGLPGFEGGFLICSFWLVEAYVLVGWIDEARALFRQLVELVGPTGLLPEQYDPVDERLLGNFPQAYSHLGLINAALAIDRAG